MVEAVQPAGHPTENPDVGHQPDDVSVRSILWFAGVLLVVAAVVHVALWGMFEFFATREARQKASNYPLAKGLRDELPPEPRLEGINPQYQTGRFREKAQSRESSPDRQEAAPAAQARDERAAIDSAMRRLENKLPVRPGAKPSAPPALPSNANSGRTPNGEKD